MDVAGSNPFPGHGVSPSHEQLEPCLHGMLCAQLQEQPGSRSRVVSRVMMGITAIDLVRGVGGGGRVQKGANPRALRDVAETGGVGAPQGHRT